MNEHGYIRAIHKSLNPDIKVWKICDDYQGGVSDVLYFGTRARILFLEYKYEPKLPARQTTRLFHVGNKRVKPLQLQWFRDLHHRGLQIGFVYGGPLGGVLSMTEEYCENGMTRATYTDQVLTNNELRERIERMVL